MRALRRLLGVFDEGLSLVYGNISARVPRAEKRPQEYTADPVVFVETRARGPRYRDLIKAVGHLGWCSVGGEADSTDVDDCSAGFLALARKHTGLPSLVLEANGGWKSSSCPRWCVATLRLEHVVVTLVPLYLVSGHGPGGRNLQILS